MEVIEALRTGRPPTFVHEEDSLVHDFCVELHRNRNVSDATWARAVARFGEQGVVDLIGINGYYALLAMTMNAARTGLPDNVPGEAYARLTD